MYRSGSRLDLIFSNIHKHNVIVLLDNSFNPALDVILFVMAFKIRPTKILRREFMSLDTVIILELYHYNVIFSNLRAKYNAKHQIDL